MKFAIGLTIALVLVGMSGPAWGQEPPAVPPSPGRSHEQAAPQPPVPPAQPQPAPAPAPAHTPEAVNAPPAARPPLPPAPPAELLLRLLAERRPELAERLGRLRRRSPERFRRVLLEALTDRLEERLNEMERGEPLPLEPLGPEGVPPAERPGPPEEHRIRVRDLEERQGRLEARSHELAQRWRELERPDANAEERRRLHDELERVVQEQFNVRSELRRVELERLGHELRRLHEMVERMERDLAEREQQRAQIVERRMRQLLGEGTSGW